MSRIEAKFKELSIRNRKALITFVTAGDPDLKTTVKLVRAMEKTGADLIELGVPYSDPIAEGPVIEAANARALKNDVRIPRIMAAVREMRRTVKVPLLYLLYYNSILQYGPDRFLRDCVEAGIDGLIVPDLPLEERGELFGLARKREVDLIAMVTPVSEDRIRKLVKGASGFLYCVSSLGVTGMRKKFTTDFPAFFSAVRRYSKLPRALGFGVSGPEQAAGLKRHCEGIIVGSAIVRKVGEAKNPAAAVRSVARFTASLRRALN